MACVILGIIIVVLFVFTFLVVFSHDRLRMQRDGLEEMLSRKSQEHIKTLQDRSDDQDELKRRLEVMMDQKREIALLKDTAKSQADSIEQFQYVRELIIELHKSASPFAVKNP